MKYFIQIIFFIISFFNLLSCNTYQRRAKDIIQTWNGKTIIFTPLNAKIMGEDTIIPNILDHKYKVLTYIDTTGCTACRLKLFDWKLFIKELNTFSEDIAFLFVIHSKNYQEFEDIQKANKFTYPVFYDYNANLKNINNFPNDPNFQTFLLDKNNKVLIIGNPVTNNNIRQLYEDILKQ